MNADAEHDAAILGHAGVAFDHRVLQFDRAADGVDHAAELDDRTVAGALDDAPVMHGDGRIDQVAAQRPQSRQDAILVRARQPAVTHDVGSQDRRDFTALAHSSGTPAFCMACSSPLLLLQVNRIVALRRADALVCGW